MQERVPVFFVAFGQGMIDTPEIAMAGIGFFLGGVFPVMIGLAGLALPSAPGLAVNVKIEEATFKLHGGNLTVDGSFMTEAHVDRIGLF